MTAPNLPDTGALVAPVVPMHRCRTCGMPAVRYMDGRRRTFYCGEHGPRLLENWSRLLTIPDGNLPIGRVLGQTSPLPVRVARLIDALVDGLRDVLTQDLPVANVPDTAAVRVLELEVERLKQQLAKVGHERDVAEEIANEALVLMDLPDATAETPVPDDPDALTEKDFPPAPSGPTPVAPSDPESFPDAPGPLPPRPRKPTPVPTRTRTGKGYTVVAPPPTPREQEDAEVVAELQQVAPTVWKPREWTSTELEMFSLETLVNQIDAGPKAPRLSVTRRALRDYKALATQTRREVLQAIEYLGWHPEALRETHLSGWGKDGLVSLRVNRGWRLICAKESVRSYEILRITRTDEQDR